MSEQDTSQERTEEATPKRQEEARNKGQISRSRELTTMFILLTSSFVFLFMGQQLSFSLENLMINNFSISRQHVFDQYFLINALLMSGKDILISFAPFLAILFAVAFFAPLLVGGWMFSAEALAPKPDKLNPISGLKRLFGVKTVMELVKALAKFVLITGIAIVFLWYNLVELLGVGAGGLMPGLAHASDIIITSFMVVCLGTMIIALVDVPFQIWEHSRQLKMTRQQVKDEMKDTEGKPEVKAQLRALQQELANGRMMEAVPDADVIITNPTHYAVALSYKPDEMSAPKLVAKGADLVAERIKAVAKENDVMIFPAPMLARSIYYNTKVDQDIPAGLYLAVAQVLAYIFQLRDNVRNAQRPPDELPIPEELKHD